MKVRAKANGTVIDLPANHGLIRAGIYVPLDVEKPAPKPKRKRKPKAK